MAQVIQPTFPLANQEKKRHRELHIRNLDAAESFRAVRELRVTASWTSAQPPGVVLQVANHLLTCIRGLLYIAGPFCIDDEVKDPTPPQYYWDFNQSESSDLGLWEVPVEGVTSRWVNMPTMLMPTIPILLFLTRAGRAIVGQHVIFEGVQFREAHENLRRLRRWVDIAEGLVGIRANRRCLLSTKLGALEEVKGWYGDISSDDLLLQFINQPAAPQTCLYVDGEGNDIDREDTSETDDEYSETDNQDLADGLL